MANRLLKESYKRSEEIMALSWFQECVFIRMIVTANDAGLLDGRVSALKSDLFPLGQGVTDVALECALACLENTGLIERVERNGKLNWHLRSWQIHQQTATKEEQPTTKQKVFRKPTVEEVDAYCKSRNNNVDPAMFVDFYESKGWKVGQTAMKDWQAAVRTWEQRRGGDGKPAKTNRALMYEQRTLTDSEASSMLVDLDEEV